MQVKIEPAAAADIAVKNSSDMERDTETKALDAAVNRILKRLDAGAGFSRGFQHAGADLLFITDILVDRKHREQSVAHIFQHLARHGRGSLRPGSRSTD